MEARDWIGLVVVLAPVLIGLAYGLLRLIGRIPPPEGLPPGRRGGMSRVRPSGPLTDAPAYAQKLKREEEARRKEESGPSGPPEP